MLKYCVEKWDKNKELLRSELATRTDLNSCDYKTLVELVVDYILNPGEYGYSDRFDSSKITVVDDGDYQGCQLFVIPIDTYQPMPNEYIIGFQNYGSCSGCDTLQSIQNWSGGRLNKEQINDFMELCKDIVCSFKHPFYSYDEEKWAEVTVDPN